MSTNIVTTFYTKYHVSLLYINTAPRWKNNDVFSDRHGRNTLRRIFKYYDVR